MATLSSVLAWRIPGTGDPGGVTQSRTQLKRLSNSRTRSHMQQLRKFPMLQERRCMLQLRPSTDRLVNLYAEYIMRNAGLEEAQAGIKISRRNINNLRYANDTTLMAQSEELKSLLMKVKEE